MNSYRSALPVAIAFALALSIIPTTPSGAEPLLKAAWEGFHAGLLQDIKAQGQSVPRSVAVGDLNGDGRPDLVAATPGNSVWDDSANVVSVHLANPLPQTVQPPYLPAALYQTGTGPMSVAIADMNHDARLDVITANSRGNSVSVLLGDGAGHLGPPIHAAAGGYPRCAAVADLNGDTHPDVVITNQSSNTVSVFPGLGNGTLGSRVDYATAATPFFVIIAELNGTSGPDLVVVNGVDAISIFFNNGSGGFGGRTDLAAVQPLSVAAGHLNGDGVTDLVVATDGPNPISVFLGTGSGGFAPRTEYAAVGLYGLAVILHDVNGDTNLDVIAFVGDPAGEQDIAVFPGNGAGGLGSPAYYDAGTIAFGMACADLDADGDRDLVTAGGGGFSESSGHTINVLRNNGSGTFGTGISQDAGLSPNYSVSADFNRDGILDVAATGASPFGVVLHRGIGNGAFAVPATFIALADSGRSIGAADLNSNATIDLVVGTASGIYTFLGAGNGFFGGGTLVSAAEGFDGELRDMNRDGRVDLITFSGSNAFVRLGSGTGTFGSALAVIAPGTVRGVGVGDLNGNGMLDLVIATASGFSVRLGNGSGTFFAGTNYLSSHSIHGKPVIADLNLDGKLDVAVADQGNVSIAPVGMTVLLGTGTGTLLSELTFPTLDLPIAGAAADMNRDGKLDLLAMNAIFNGRPGTVSLLEGNGSGTFSARTDHGAGQLGGRILMGDYDRDGRPDVAVTTKTFQSPGTGRLKVLRGNAPGTFGSFSAKVDHAGLAGEKAVAVGDVNRDGRPDAIVLGTNAVAVCFGNGLGALGAPVTTALPANPLAMAVADMNLDGNLDLALSFSTGVARVYFGDGAGGFNPAADVFFVGATPSALAVGDLIEDGWPDIVVADEGPEDLSIIAGGGGAFFFYTTLPAEPGPKSITLADVNVDGELDIVVGYRSISLVSTFFNFGFGLFQEEVGPASSPPTSVAAGDFNRDGKPDVAFTHETAGADMVGILLGTGMFPNPFLPGTDYPLPNNPQHIAVSDVDQDGDEDLIVGGPTTNLVSVLLGSGTGTFAARVDYATGTLPSGVAIGDLNLDGRPDILVSNTTSANTSVLLNAGSVITGVEAPAPAAPSATRLAQNAPNPFNPRTTIRFQLEAAGAARLMVFDVGGRHVATLVERNLPAGEHRVDWDGRDDAGRAVASGVYFQRLEGPGFSDSRAMVLLK